MARNGWSNTSSAWLHEAGVLLSHFDELSDTNRPWEQNSNLAVRHLADRRSSSLVFASMPRGQPPANVPGAIPLFGASLAFGARVHLANASSKGMRPPVGGFVLRPDVLATGGILCSYAFDAVTFDHPCSSSAGTMCIPGCAERGQYYNGAFAPRDLQHMLREFMNPALPAHDWAGNHLGYNEVVLDFRVWRAMLPHTSIGRT
jgi:hypothetical protein